QGTTFPLVQGEISIGRDGSNQLCISDAALSRRHCVIAQLEDGQFMVRDLQSRNGTIVNGVMIDAHPLAHGDQISIGESVLVCLLQDAEERHLRSSPVEFAETAEVDKSAVVLKQEDAVYLQPDKLTTGLPANSRLARDLTALLKIATGIGGIRDREALQW